MSTAGPAGRPWIPRHEGRPLYFARRTLHIGAGLLADEQIDRLAALFGADGHVEIEATWVYQRMITALRHEGRRRGRELVVRMIGSRAYGVPAALVEVASRCADAREAGLPGASAVRRRAGRGAGFHREGCVVQKQD